MPVPRKNFVAFLPRTVLIGLIVGSTFSTACSGGGDESAAVVPVGLSANFTSSGAAAATDLVRISGSTSGDRVALELRIGGPTTDDDLYSFAFDLVLGDETVARYVPGSATIGSALTLSGSQQGQVFASQIGNRITVGVTKLGGGAGNRVPAPEGSVMTLTLEVLRAGSTSLRMEGSPPNPPSALDSSGAPIVSVTFDGAAATVTGR